MTLNYFISYNGNETERAHDATSATLRRKRSVQPETPTSVLTFGMIPHITQERRAENNIHHTGRVKGTVVEAEKMRRRLVLRMPP